MNKRILKFSLMLLLALLYVGCDPVGMSQMNLLGDLLNSDVGPTLSAEQLLDSIESLNQRKEGFSIHFPVTDENKTDIAPGHGSVSYYPDRSVLMLSSVNIESIEINTPLTIIFAGRENSVGTIRSSKALTLSSYSTTDKLTVSTTNGCAITVENANLTISSGADVFAQSSGGAGLSVGVDVSGTLEISGKLTANGGSATESYGIRCNTLTVKAVSSASGGQVTATGGDSYTGSSTGIKVYGNAAVEYMAELTAYGQAASGTSCGLSAGSLTVRGKAVLSAGSGWGGSTALSCGDVTSWGNLSANSGTSSAGASRGITAARLSVSGGSLDAHASSGTGESVGIKAAVTVSGGTVLSEGMSSAFSEMPSFTGGYQPLIRVSDLITPEAEADSSVPANYMKKFVFIRARSLHPRNAAGDQRGSPCRVFRTVVQQHAECVS